MTVPITIQAQNLISAEQKQSLRKLLVIRRGGIGDIILATPALRMLASRLPDVCVDMVVQHGAADAISGLPYIRTVYEVDSRSNPFSLFHLRKLAQRLRDGRYDLVVNFQPGAKTNYLASFCRPRYSLTFQKDRTVQTETGQVRHAIDDFVHTLLPLQLGALCDGSLDFAVPDVARAQVNTLLRQNGYVATETHLPLIVLNPTARRIVNRWPEIQWARLVDSLCKSGAYRVVVIGAGRDLAAVRKVKALSREWRQVIDFSGGITLKELGALLELASAFVTADTGPMHVGAAVGAPVVCLSGAADPCRTGPKTLNSLVLIDRSLPCVPCQNKHCRYSKLPRCMDGISVEDVLAAVQRLVRSPSAIDLTVLQV